MAGKKNPRSDWSCKCAICNVDFTFKDAYVLHLIGKRHQKSVKKRDQKQNEAILKKSVCFFGRQRNTSLEKIVANFLNFGITSVTHNRKSITIEFETEETAMMVLKRRHYNIFNTHLKATPVMPQSFQDEEVKVSISPFMKEILANTATGYQLDYNINALIREIELKPTDLMHRDILRGSIVRYLSPHFPQVLGYTFGSSANNLGFTGCDVDIYLDIGIYPWVECETRVAAQAEARDLTWYLANKIRQSGRTIKVEAVPRARVPIVKFQDRSTGLWVDLSFRHPMPVHNTQLIRQYTMTHPLVRPYIMVVRYWAKVQEVAGGGKPSHLITNYALTMMLMFYLMYRQDPIVPSVSYLREGRDYKPTFIGPWDVGFCSNVQEWTQKLHRVSVMDLVSEFFAFYGDLDAFNWVISPLTGMLLAKNDVSMQSIHLPPCLRTCFEQDEELQLNTELCVQDPFELTLNCTRGLGLSAFLDFQHKCRAAEVISNNIIKGKQTLSDLYKPIKARKDVGDDGSEEDLSQSRDDDEVITLDDSDTSQDIEVLGSVGRKGQNATHRETPDTVVLSSSEISDIEILSESHAATDREVEILSGPQRSSQTSSERKKKSSEALESTSKHSDQNETQSQNSEDIVVSTLKSEREGNVSNGPSSSSSNGGESSNATQVDVKNSSSRPSSPPVLSNTLGEKTSKFELKFFDVPEFTITPDGNVHKRESESLVKYDPGHTACSLIQFVLEQCLKVKISTAEEDEAKKLNGKKRKSGQEGDEGSPRKHAKTSDGNSVSFAAKYRRLGSYACTTNLALWNHRKKISKTVPRGPTDTPLQLELAITQAQMRDCMLNPENRKPLKLRVEVWQEVDYPELMHVTVYSVSDTDVTRRHMIPMFSYFDSLCQNLLKKLTRYINTGTY